MTVSIKANSSRGGGAKPWGLDGEMAGLPKSLTWVLGEMFSRRGFFGKIYVGAPSRI